jgi:hypothetical protein
MWTSCHFQRKNGGGGIRTPLNASDTSLQKDDKSTTEITQGITITDTYENSQNSDLEQKLTVLKHYSDTCLHKKCALCVPKNFPDELKELIVKWPGLPENIRGSIKLLVRSATI